LKSLHGLDEENFEWFASLLRVKSRRRKVLVAEVNGKVVGFIIAYKFRNRAYIDSLAVDPEWRGKGIGITLLRKLEELLANEGVKCISLSVKEFNREALGFYIRSGYSVKGVVLLLEAMVEHIKIYGAGDYEVKIENARNTVKERLRVLPSTWWSSLTEPVDRKVYGKTGDELIMTVYKNRKLRGLIEFSPEKHMVIDYLAVSYHKPTEALTTLLSVLKQKAKMWHVQTITIPVDATKTAIVKKLLEYGFKIQGIEYKLVKQLKRL